MTTHYGAVDPDDVTERVRPHEGQWKVTLIYEPRRLTVSAVDRTELLARQKAWITLRDKLEGYGG